MILSRELCWRGIWPSFRRAPPVGRTGLCLTVASLLRELCQLGSAGERNPVEEWPSWSDTSSVWACFRVFDNDLSLVPTLPCSISVVCRPLVLSQPTSCRHGSDTGPQL